jgi:phage shock protein PspC (stress-responsive transcriptional regulator)
MTFEISLVSIVLLLTLILVTLVAVSVCSAQDKAALGTMLRNLRKSKTDKNISGVCGGLGEHTPVPSWIWRALFLVLLFCGGVGLIAYIILAICMPPPAKG